MHALSDVFGAPAREAGDLAELVASIVPVDDSWQDRAWQRLDSLTKPPRSLGRLEEIAARVAGIQQTLAPRVDHKRIVLMAGDHGIVAEGVSPYPQEVTAQMVANFASGGAAINQLAASVGAELTLVDAGVAADVSSAGNVRVRKIEGGTRNMVRGPAMSTSLAIEALLMGADFACEAAADGVDVLGTGEMGIGNTTPAAALTCAYTTATPADVVGPGTGLDAEGVRHKAEVVTRALEVNASELGHPLSTLAALGGFEIAGLAGLMLGAASARIPVVVDGFISGAAALSAVALCPACLGYLLPSHRSAEPGHTVLLEHLGLIPVLDLDMRLGEGTGAALALAIVDASCRMMSGMATFDEAGVTTASRGSVEQEEAAGP